MLLYERQLEEKFDDFLNEVCEIVTICGYNYDPARALKSIDPVAYNQEFLTWLDNEVTEGLIFEKDGEYFDEDPNTEK